MYMYNTGNSYKMYITCTVYVHALNTYCMKKFNYRNDMCTSYQRLYIMYTVLYSVHALYSILHLIQCTFQAATCTVYICIYMQYILPTYICGAFL